jgi:aspartate/methionine/tyrosine aminotransferase
MRPTSRYLYSMIYETPPCKINLSGSAPPFTQGPGYFSDLPFLTDVNDIKERTTEFTNDLAKRQKARGEEFRFSVGSSMVYTQILAAITEPGDTILLESPTYDPFIFSAEFLNVKVKFFNRTANFAKDFAEIKKLARGVKAIVVSNPNCPTGQMYSRDELLQLAPLAKMVIVDEVFLPLFEGGRQSLLDGDRPENIITIGSFSKSCGLGPLRLGWVRAAAKPIAAFEKIALNLQIDVPSFAIVAGQRALKNWDDLIAPNLRLADANRRDVMAWNLANPGVLSHDFKKGYFGTMKVPKEFKSGDEFAEHFLQKTGVWLRPTRQFRLPKSVRFQLLVDSENWQRISPQLMPK